MRIIRFFMRILMNNQKIIRRLENYQKEREKKMKLFDNINDDDLFLEIEEILIELSEKYDFDLEKSEKIDFFYDESDNSIHIKLIDRYYYREMIIYQRNEMIYIDSIEDYQRLNIFSINSILLDELFENNDIILKFIRDYYEKIFIFDEL